jgi:phenylacetate-CoA ligase
MELSVIVPCLDEEENIRALVSRVQTVFATEPFARLGGELILVDDGSTDGSWALIELLRDRHSFVRAIHHHTNRGIAESWRSGAAIATGRLVSVLDADLQYPPEDLLRLHAALLGTGADVAQGARTGRRPGSRFFISRGLSAILNRLFAMELRDNQSGFMVLRKELFEDLLAHRGRYHHWQNLAMVAARAHGLRIAEIATAFGERTAGRSAFGDFPVRATLEVLEDVGRAWFEYRPGAAEWR